MREGYIYEGFVSFQGEGKYVGKPQFFLRLAGCSLKCKHCDTKYAWKRPNFFYLRNLKFKESFRNPIRPDSLAEVIDKWRVKSLIPQDLSITGGEPVEQIEFLEDFLKIVSKFKVWLETGGYYPSAVKKVIDLVDVVSVDIKLQTFVGKKLDLSPFLKTVSFLRNKDAYIKIVYTGSTSLEEIENVLKMLKKKKVKIPVFLQPSSPNLWRRAFKLSLRYSTYLDVRILPQVHKLINAR